MCPSNHSQLSWVPESVCKVAAKRAHGRPQAKTSRYVRSIVECTPTCGYKTFETIGHLGFKVLQHFAYSSDLAPSDYHLFSSLKDALRDCRKHSVKRCTNGCMTSQKFPFKWNLQACRSLEKVHREKWQL